MSKASNIIKHAKDDQVQHKLMAINPTDFIMRNLEKQQRFKKTEEERLRLKKLKKELNVPVLKLVEEQKPILSDNSQTTVPVVQGDLSEQFTASNTNHA